MIRKGNTDRCSKWSLVGEREAAFRKDMFDRIGPTHLQAVQAVPRSQLEPKEVFDPEKEEEMGEIPDFAGMLYDGISVSERESQLRYETDDDGNLLADDDGKSIPRGTFPLRKYITDPKGPIQNVPDVVMFWTTSDLIRAILRKEKELGWVITDGMAKKQKQKGSKVPTKATRTPRKKEEKASMPRKRIVLRRGKDGDGNGGDGGKTDKPATNKRRKKTTTEDTGSNGDATTDGLEEAVEAALKRQLAPFKKALEKLGKLVEEKTSELDDRLATGLTILHDVLVQKLNEAEGVKDPRHENLMTATTDDDIFSYLDDGDGGGGGGDGDGGNGGGD